MNTGRSIEKMSRNKGRKEDRQTYCANDEFGYKGHDKRKRRNSRQQKRA